MNRKFASQTLALLLPNLPRILGDRKRPAAVNAASACSSRAGDILDGVVRIVLAWARGPYALLPLVLHRQPAAHSRQLLRAWHHLTHLKATRRIVCVSETAAEGCCRYMDVQAREGTRTHSGALALECADRLPNARVRALLHIPNERACRQTYRWHLEKNAIQMPAVSWRLTQPDRVGKERRDSRGAGIVLLDRGIPRGDVRR